MGNRLLPEAQMEQIEKPKIDNERLIEAYRSEIFSCTERIKVLQKEILRLQGKVIDCPHCRGEGKIMTIHRFSGPNEYMR